MDKNNLKRYNSDILSKSLKIKNVDTISNTTSSLMPQKGGYLDATSSFMPQKGSYLNNNNNNKNKDKDINQLMSMLSATSESNYTTNSTNTEEIKNKLLNILQDGGTIEDYNDLLDIFTVFYTIIISLDLKDYDAIKQIENMMDTNDNKYLDKIINILNKLNQREIYNFLRNLEKEYISSPINSLNDHPILIYIYNKIISSIKNDKLNEFIHNIRIILYNNIKETLGLYLSNPPEQITYLIERSEKKYDYLSFSTMLKYIRDDIENNLISYLTQRTYIPLASSARSSSIPLASSTAPLQRLSALALSSRSYTQPPSIQLASSSTAPQPHSYAVASSSRSEQPRLLQDSRAFIEQPFSSRSYTQPPSIQLASSSTAPQPHSYAVASSSRSEQPRLLQDSRAFIEQPFSSRLSSAAASSYTPLQRLSAASLSSRSYTPPPSNRTIKLSSEELYIKKLYNEQLTELRELFINQQITGDEYFDTKLALAEDIILNNRNIVDSGIIIISRAISDALESRQIIDRQIYYNDPTTKPESLFRIFEKGKIYGSTLMIYKREYYNDVY